ncbi:TetR/AcrR family transcriptional regulator [Actinoplanes couchii]|uniref:TetR family transcriptional regulator n=1 Tax=Actinoplanes couchii TaxID=403638 RepID=A0ABQ3XLJ4_9ACTN|nr:TetR/AcrR family transcriptional regulator [Actinoplanes couchii]MDR6318251.1 AcrR family transcriptional regulator [Actinoplanes couchii]GID59378.1 TetR family transcriptional regulator [Actinoplanes couchii]
MTEPAGRRVRTAALELFAERGFHGTGIRDLAQRAGLSTATLYHYMGTKEDLLAEIMRDSMRLLLLAAGQTGTFGTPTERIARLTQIHVLAHAARPLHTRVADDEIRALSAPVRAEITALRDEYEDFWQSAIDDGVTSGEFRVAAPTVARLALLEMCSGVARWYRPDGPLTASELAARYVEMALGLLTVDGAAPALDPGAADDMNELVSELWPL